MELMGSTTHHLPSFKICRNPGKLRLPLPSKTLYSSFHQIPEEKQILTKFGNCDTKNKVSLKFQSYHNFELKKSPGFPLTLTHSLQIGYNNLFCLFCLWKYLSVYIYIYQYIPGKLEYIQVWETRRTQFPQDPPQRSQFDLDRQFRPWKKKLFQTKRNISTTARIEWEKKKAIHNEIFRPRNWFHTTQGFLCRIFRCGNWSEPSWANLAFTHYRPWIICY